VTGFNSQQGRIFLSATASRLAVRSPSLLFCGYWNSFLREIAAGCEAVTHLNLVLRLKNMELYLHYSIFVCMV
jgi:hypothetical protein